MNKSAFAFVFLAALFCGLQVAPTAGLDWTDACKLFVPFPFTSMCTVLPTQPPSTGNGNAGGGAAANTNDTSGNATRSLPLLGKLPLGLPLR